MVCRKSGAGFPRLRGRVEIVLKCPANFRRRERHSVVEVNSRTQFEREGPGVIRDCPLACQHGTDGAVVPRADQAFDHVQQYAVRVVVAQGPRIKRHDVGVQPRAEDLLTAGERGEDGRDAEQHRHAPEPAAETAGFIGGWLTTFHLLSFLG